MKKTFLILSLILIGLHNVTNAQIVLDIKTNYMVYSPSKDKLYATVSSTDVNYGNELIVINPHTGVIESNIYVGSEPGEIKISSKDEYLYIILKGTPQIVRMVFSSLTIDKYIQVNSKR